MWYAASAICLIVLTLGVWLARRHDKTPVSSYIDDEYHGWEDRPR